MITTHYNGADRWDWMQSLISVLRDRASVGRHIEQYGWDALPDNYKPRYPDPNPANYRTWYYRESNTAPMHPAIRQAVMLAPPADWHLLVLEYPHAADSDPTRIAYTRSDAHGEADRQTVTSVGKYLTRHFPTLRDHDIRDIVMRHGKDRFELWDDVSKIVYSVQEGPHSCMRWGNFNRDTDTHPYEAYHPDYGWRAAVRLDGSGIITARCLININSKTFVRSYTRKNGEYSHSDEAIEVWLRDQGFTKAYSWTGCKLARITTDRYKDDFWAPYIDGDCKYVSDMGDHLLIDSSGDYECDRTDGHASSASSHTCDSCGDRVHEDDLYSIGYHGDEHVGACCLDAYAYVSGRNGCEYYIPRDDAVYVDSQETWYDPEYLSRYDIVELDNGDYEHIDNAVHLEYRDIWVEMDDDCVVYCDHSSTYEHVDDCVQLENGNWALEDDAWQCEHDEKWYLNEEDSVETECGKTVHAKYEDEYTTNTEEN